MGLCWCERRVGLSTSEQGQAEGCGAVVLEDTWKKSQLPPPAVRRLTTWTQSIFPRTGCAPTFVAPTATSPHSHVDGCESNLRLSCELTSARCCTDALEKSTTGPCRDWRGECDVECASSGFLNLFSHSQSNLCRRGGPASPSWSSPPPTLGLQRKHPHRVKNPRAPFTAVRAAAL